MSELGWEGKIVRHEDGRRGRIYSEYVGLGFASVFIAVDGTDRDDDPPYVQFNCLRGDTSDGGDPGWHYWCENFADGPCWLPLGDHTKRRDFHDTPEDWKRSADGPAP